MALRCGRDDGLPYPVLSSRLPSFRPSVFPSFRPSVLHPRLPNFPRTPYSSTDVRYPHRQRPAEQPAGNHGRDPPPGADRHHRPVRLRQEHARLRHALRRRPAAVHRVALHLRQAVSRADAEAAGGSPRGHRPVGGHRAAESHREQPLDGGDRHRGVRLPPPALGPRRPELLPRLRRAGSPRHPAERSRRRPGRRPGRANPGGLPAPAGRPPHPRRRGGESPGPRLRPGPGRRCAAPSRRAAARARLHARRRAPGDRRPAGGRAGGGGPDGRGGGDGVPGGRRGGDRARPAASFGQPTGSGSRASPPAAPATPRPPPSRRRCSRSTTRAVPAASATASGQRSSTTSRSSCPTPRGAWPAARSTPGPSRATNRAAGSLLEFARSLGADPDKPWHKLKVSHRRELLRGRKGRYVGIFPFLKDLEEKRYKQYIRVFLRQYQLARTCEACGGTRLNADALAVRIGDDTIAGVACRSIDGIEQWVTGLSIDAVRAGGRRPHRRPARCPPRVPAGRGARLPHARPPDPHALGRRGAADLARQRAGIPAGRYALRARRAVGRPAPAGHRSAAGAAPPPARRRQHRRGRRARSRRHPPGRLHARARPRRRRPRRARGPRRSGRGSTAVAHGAVPHRREAHRGAEPAPACRAALAPDPRRHAPQPPGRRRRHPARDPHRDHRRERLRQEQPAPRRGLPRPRGPARTAGTRPRAIWASRWVRWRR